MAIPALPGQELGGDILGVRRNINALRRSDLENQIKQAEAQYAPYTNYANAASKIAYSNLLPYQIQAQIMSNPMMWMAIKDNPDAIKALMSNFQQSIPSGKNIFGNINLPQPGRMQTSINPIVDLLNQGIGGLFGGNGNSGRMSSQNSMTQQSSEPTTLNAQSPLNSPSMGTGKSRIAPGGLQGLVDKNTAPFAKNPYGKAETVTTNQGTFVTPSEQTVNSAQQAMLGVENIKPLLKDISRGASRFLASGQKGKLAVGSMANLAQQYGGNLFGIPERIMKSAGITKKDLTDYAEWQSKIKSSAETISKIRNWPQDELALKTVMDIMQPHLGEGEDYGNRVARQLSEYEKTIVPNYQKTLAQGQTLIPPQNEPSKGAKILAKDVVVPKFSDGEKGKKEFQDWYLRQPKITQDAIKLHLGKK